MRVLGIAAHSHPAAPTSPVSPLRPHSREPRASTGRTPRRAGRARTADSGRSARRTHGEQRRSQHPCESVAAPSSEPVRRAASERNAPRAERRRDGRGRSEQHLRMKGDDLQPLAPRADPHAGESHGTQALADELQRTCDRATSSRPLGPRERGGLPNVQRISCAPPAYRESAAPGRVCLMRVLESTSGRRRPLPHPRLRPQFRLRRDVVDEPAEHAVPVLETARRM